jgi:DNA-binding XRE family transcriptional regulator
VLKLDRDELIRARERLGYAVETVAEEAGVSKNSVLRAEHGQDIRPLTARKIAAALGVAVADLYREPDYPKGKASHSQERLFNNGAHKEERRSPSVAKAVSDVAEKWHEMASNPDASPREISEAVGAALALGEALMGRFGPPSASNYTAEQWEAIHLAARLLEIAEAGNGRILGLGEEEQNRARQEQIRELTRRISA